MSKYDDEREKILNRMKANNISFTPSVSTKSKYDDERSSPQTTGSKYDQERADMTKYNVNTMRAGSAQARIGAEENQRIFKQKESEQNKKSFEDAGLGFGGSEFNRSMTKISTVSDNANQFAASEKARKDAEISAKARWDEEHGRNIPVLGQVLRGMDTVSDFIKPGTDVAQTLYTPGAGLTVANLATKSAGNLISKLAPGLAGSAGGRLTQNVAKEAFVGAPLAIGNKLARDPNATFGEVAQEGALGAVGGGAIPAIGAGLRGLRGLAQNAAGDVAGNALRGIKGIEANGQPSLALPAPRARGNINQADTPNVIEVPETGPRGLPSGNPVQRQKFNIAGNNQTLNRVMTEIKPEVESIITPPTRRDLLINYIQRNMDIPKEEIWNMPIKDLQDLGAQIRQGMNIPEIAVDVARKRGYDLPSLLDGNAPSIGQRVSQDARQRAYGVYPGELPNTRKPESFTVSQMGQAAAPVERVGFRRNNQPQAVREPINVKSDDYSIDVTEPVAQGVPQSAPAQITRTVRENPIQAQTDEFKFSQTVKNSDSTDEALARAMNENPMTGARTSNSLNQQAAQALINRHGAEKLTNMLISKRGTLSPAENTAAQMLAKYYSNIGGDDNLSKAVDIISKTARSGRELGQAVQALSQWNKLSAEGVILLAERQLNRRIKDTEDWVSLTTEQGKPLKAVGQKLESVQEAKTLADDVVKMLANRTPNTPFTDAEKSLIQHFNKQVNTVDEQVQPLLRQKKDARDKAIKEVGAIKPKERTRDQVVNFLDAQADRAREKLRKQRNIGLLANTENPVILYTIIGADYIAKKVVKFADWSEAMVKEGITEKLPELYTKSVNKFRKENGLPTNDELNQLVSKAIRAKTIDEKTAHSIKVAVAEIGFAADDAKKELTRDLQKVLRRLGDVTGGEMIKAYLNSAMLLNLITFGKNAGGLIQQLMLDKVNKAFSVPIDWASSKFTGERTVKFFTKNQANLWKSGIEGTVEGWDGVTKSGVLDEHNIRTEVFRGKLNPFRYLQKLTGASIESLDRAGYDMAHGEVMATYAHYLGKQMGLSRQQIKEQMPSLIRQLGENVERIADEAAAKATYQDDSIFARLAKGIQQTLNKPTNAIGRGMREAGLPAWMSPEGFGAGDVVLFFAKTPANLVMRGLEYSPMGFFMSAGHILKALPKGRIFDQRAFSLALGKTITGTLGLSMVGWDLYNKGILTGPSSQDADVRSLEEAAGRGAYKVNVNALYRYVTSFFDAETAKPQKGDRMMDYAWLQPAAISVGMGVSAAMAVDKARGEAEKEGLEYNHKFYNIAKTAIAGGLQTVFENPMFQGLTDVADIAATFSKGDGDGGLEKSAKLFTGVPAMFVPTVSGQVRRLQDNQMRETTDRGSLLNTAKNQVLNKLPGFSKKLPQSYNVLGQPREYVQGGKANSWNQALQQLITPVKNSKFSPSPDAQLVLDLIQQTGDNKVIPRLQKKSIEVTNPITKMPKTIDLTPQQFADLQQRVGVETIKELQELVNRPSFQSLTPDKKSDKVQALLTKIGTDVRNDLKKSLGYKVKK